MKIVNYAFNIDDEIKINNMFYLVVDRYCTINDNKKIKYYVLQCSICNGLTTKDEKYLKRLIKENKIIGCNLCASRVSAQNRLPSVAEEEPWIIPLFKHSKDAYTVSSHSGQYKEFCCPICNTDKLLSVKQVVRDKKIHCQRCDDGYSYPNKVGLELLLNLPIEELEVEFSDDWTQNKRYDFSFKYNNTHYLLEMDGAMHFENAYNTNVNVVKNNDLIKNELAKNNNCNIIRIDCRKSEFEYIKNNIYQSELNMLFDLSKVNWKQIELNVVKNRMLEVCGFYNAHKCSTATIAEEFKMAQATIIRYLKKCRNLGLTDYITPSENFEIVHEEVLVLYEQNIEPKEIASILDIPLYTVKEHIKKREVA